MMPPKSSAHSKASGNEPKCQRSMLTIKEKVELLDMLKEGKSYAVVGCHYGIHESSVRYIKKDERNIRSIVLGGDSFSDMIPDNMNDLIIVHSQSLKHEDLREMMKSASEEEDEEQDELQVGEEEEVGLTLNYLATMVRMAKEIKGVAEEWDPQWLCLLLLVNTIKGGMPVYKILLTQKKKQHQQLPITMFISQRKRSVMPMPVVEIEVTAQGKDTAPPDEAPDKMVPSEEL